MPRRAKIGLLCANAAVGVAEAIALAAVSLTAIGMAGKLLASGVKALWAISGNLAANQAKVAATLEVHAERLDEHDNRLREGGL